MEVPHCIRPRGLRIDILVTTDGSSGNVPNDRRDATPGDG